MKCGKALGGGGSGGKGSGGGGKALGGGGSGGMGSDVRVQCRRNCGIAAAIGGEGGGGSTSTRGGGGTRRRLRQQLERLHIRTVALADAAVGCERQMADGGTDGRSGSRGGTRGGASGGSGSCAGGGGGGGGAREERKILRGLWRLLLMCKISVPSCCLPLRSLLCHIDLHLLGNPR
eukprot:7377325-Prymnesium_polylepis.1